MPSSSLQRGARRWRRFRSTERRSRGLAEKCPGHHECRGGEQGEGRKAGEAVDEPVGRVNFRRANGVAKPVIRDEDSGHPARPQTARAAPAHRAPRAFRGSTGAARGVGEHEHAASEKVQNLHAPEGPGQVTMLSNTYINAIFDAVVEATEEAIVNALLAAETMTGRDGITAYRLDPERLLALPGVRG